MTIAADIPNSEGGRCINRYDHSGDPMKQCIKLVAVIILINLFNSASAQPDNRFRQPHSMNQFEILIYTMPDHWHDLTKPVALQAFQTMAQKHAFGLTWTTLHEKFNDEDLSGYDAVVFLHASSKYLNRDQLNSLKTFIRKGGGFVGIHGSSYCNGEEEWYQKLIGRILLKHPQEQTAVLTVIDQGHPSTLHLREKWLWTDEWYSFSEALTKDLKDLITVDESTYDPALCWGNEEDTSMGPYHPIAWYQNYEGGRSFYSSLGHMPSHFEDPVFLNHLYGGIYWAATGLGY